MITNFGKELRKIRVDHNEILKDMAEHLQVSSSFLSAVEVGKKSVPDNWVGIIADEYGLSDVDRQHLCILAEDAVKSIKIDLYGHGEPQRNAALVFARDFSVMSPETAEKVIQLMVENKNRR